MGCGSSVAQEPATKSSQDLPKNSPKPTLMRADKYLSREEARERRQQAIKEKQLQSQNNAQAISAQALIDQERLSTSTKRSLRSYASSSTTTPLKTVDNSKLLDVQNPVSATSDKNVTTHSEDAGVSSSSSQQTAEVDRVPQGVIVEGSVIDAEKTEGTVSQQLGLAEGDHKTLEHSANEVGGKIECVKDGENTVITLPEKFAEDNYVIKGKNSETVKEENVGNDSKEKNERLPKKTETGPVIITDDTKTSLNDEECEKNGDGCEEILKTNNVEEKSSVRFSDTVTVVESSVPQGQRSSDESGASLVETASNQAARTESEAAQDEDEGTMDHHVINDTEVVKPSSRVREEEFNDASEGSDEGVADLGEMGEENEVEVFPVAS